MVRRGSLRDHRPAAPRRLVVRRRQALPARLRHLLRDPVPCPSDEAHGPMKTIAALLLMCAAAAAQVDQKRVDDAVRKGVEFLKTAKTPAVGFAKIDDTFELVLWTMVHAGVPQTDPKFQELFKKMLEGPLERTYKVVLQAMILEEVDRVKHQARIHQCAQFLVDNQCANGQWSYGEPTAYVKDLPPAKEIATSAKPATGAREFGAPGKKEKPKVTRKI